MSRLPLLRQAPKPTSFDFFLADELSKINLVDVVLPTSAGVEIRKRCITRPTEHQEILLQYLGLKIPRQFKRTWVTLDASAAVKTPAE